MYRLTAPAQKRQVGSFYRYRLIPQLSDYFREWVPYGVEVEDWLCNPRVNGSIPGSGNLKKLLILDENDSHKIKQIVTEL